jgi:hypothetical protein
MFLTFSTSSFIPFDDTLNLNTVRKSTSDSFFNERNLSKSNNQGTNIKNIKEIANSSQPKIWGGEVKNSKTGELDHQQKNVYTIGEIATFTNFQGSTKFIDSEKYDALSILSNRENENIFLNDGPQTNYEASMDPLPIAFKNPESEGVGSLLSNRGVKGSVDFQNGNGLLFNKTNRNSSNTSFSFLDEGESRFGTTNNGAIKVPGFTLNFGVESSKDFNPFTDKENLETILNDQFPNLSITFINSMLNLTSGSRATEESLFRKTSGGQNWYSHNSATKNTDSIAFGGLVKGS